MGIVGKFLKAPCTYIQPELKMPRRRAFRDLLALIRHFLEANPDYFSASEIGEAIGADPRVVARHLDILRELGHVDEAMDGGGVKLVRWKKVVG